MKSLAHQYPDAKQATQEDFEQALEDFKYLLKAEAADVTKQDHFPADQSASMLKRFAQKLLSDVEVLSVLCFRGRSQEPIHFW